MLTSNFFCLILNISERMLLHSHEDIYSQKNWRLCYRASQDGDRAKDFHDKCDGLSPICIIIKSKIYNHVFGAVSHIPFDSKSGCVHDPKMRNWLFRVRSDIFVEKLSTQKKILSCFGIFVKIQG